jgi:two-component system, NtrC family, sensor kinase
MKCPRCQHDNRLSAKFCEECGTSVGAPAPTPNSYADLKREIEGLKGENEGLRRSLGDAIEQQTAAAEILRVISSSPTELQPVLDAVAESATRLCAAYDAVIFRRDGDVLRIAAHYGPISSTTHTVPIRGTVSGRAVLGRQPIQVADLQAETREFPEGVTFAREHGFRSLLSVPLVREGAAIGTINLRRTEVRPFTDSQIALLQTFADQAVIAIENVRLFTELQEKNRALTEALEQQTATSEILRVISSSPTDLQPVFDMVVRNAGTLCGAAFGGLHRLDSGRITLDAHYGIPDDELMILQRDVFPLAISRGSPTGRAILDREVVHIRDIREDPGFRTPRLKTMQNYRTILAVPMMREDVPLGALALWRREVQPFSETEIGLVRTFADQAVIAIENVRLFKELQEKNQALTQAHAQVSEALKQQTATSEILRVISSSPTDVQPVFDTIAERAVRLCDAAFGAVFRFDGEWMNITALNGLRPDEREAALRYFPRRPTPGGPGLSHVVLTGEVAHIPDVQSDPAWRASGSGPAFSTVEGFRAFLAVPLIREGLCLGAVNVWRREASPFSEQHIELLKTFADQAVIAIENVRLFKELQASNCDLTEALEQQTAASEILKVISSSPTDVQPVFEAVAASARRLCDGTQGALLTYDGALIHLAAQINAAGAYFDSFRQAFPMAPSRASAATRAVLYREVIQVPDVLEDPEYVLAPTAQAGGFRSVVAVPMLREGAPIGVIIVTRAAPGSFPENQVAILQTFAHQAVIAIENVRLFRELEARTAALTRSVGELRALGAVGQALSSTLDVDVVLDTIVTRANDLIGADGCTIFEYDEVTEQFHLRATRNLEPRLVELARGTPLRKGDQGILGQLPMERQAVQVPDITAGSYSSPISDALIEAGYRAVVAVPLIREDHLIGALTMNRKTPGEFPDETIELLRTFATQSALAIQNARLFREIADKSRQLEIASQHKSEFLANMSHELRTPLNAIIGFSEVLSERMFGDLNEKQDEYLKDIHASGQHLLSLINDILDLSKIEAGRMELEVTDFDLPMAIDNAMTLIRERAARRSIALHTTVDERLGQVQADERKIRQVLLNLLSNAIKFTPEGGRVEVGAKAVDGSIEVSVSDTGVGIAPRDQEAVFEEFRQVGTADKKVEGTGLGLALSRKFIELHGGKIWVNSQVGAGSTFTFTIPVRRGE